MVFKYVQQRITTALQSERPYMEDKINSNKLKPKLNESAFANNFSHNTMLLYWDGCVQDLNLSKIHHLINCLSL